MQFVQPMPFYDAVQKFGDQSPIGSALMSDEWSDVPLALRERAFFSSQVENARFLQRAMDSINDFLQSNREDTEGGPALKTGSRAQFVEQMREFALSEGMGPIDESQAGGLRDITSEQRLSLIFNTQVQQANDYGYWRQGMNPDVLDEFPAQRFIRVKEVKEPRETHQRYEDQVYLKTDPIWAKSINEDFGVPWGPWAWGCGHDVEDVDRAEAEQLGLLKPDEVVEPDTANFNENLRASTNGLDPDLLDKLKNEFGDQLSIEGEEMRWQPAEAPEPVTRDHPVSDAIDPKVSGTLLQDVNGALAAIDRVHDDGNLSDIELFNSRQSSYGYFASTLNAGTLEADRMAVRSTGPWPSFTTVHEVGHFLDLEAIGQKGDFATLSGDREMKRVLDAAESTDAIKALRLQLQQTTSDSLRAYYQYLLSPQEIWARAYSQFVAERSGSKSLERDLAKAIEAQKNRQWMPADFAPVGEAIENMFSNLGWL